MQDNAPLIEPETLRAAAAHELWHLGDLSFKLKPTQVELREWWRGNTKAALSIAHCNRGYGKTFWFLSEAAEAGMKVHPLTKNLKRPVRMIYAAPSREQAGQIVIPTAEIFFEDCPKEIRPSWVASSHAYVWPDGSSLIIDGADDERGNHLRGPYADIVFCDEQGFWRHCNYVTKTVLMPQVHRVGGRMLGASTSPESVGHEFVSLCFEAMGEGAYIKRTIDDDHTLSEAERHKRMRDLADERHKDNPRKSTAVQRELLCAFVTETERAVVPEFIEADNVVAGWGRPHFCHKYTAMDLGLIDYAHMLFGFYDFHQATIVIEDEHVANYSTTEQLAAALKLKEHALWDSDKPEWQKGTPKLRISDNELQQLHDLHLTHGVHFQPAMKYDAEAALNRVRELMAAKRIKIHQRCKQLIHQLKVGIWNARRTDYERLPGAGHLDGIDALKYLVRHVDYQTNPLPDVGYRSDVFFVSPDLRAEKSAQAAQISKLFPTVAR